MKARQKKSGWIWTIEHESALLVQIFSGQVRLVIPRVEFESDWEPV